MCKTQEEYTWMKYSKGQYGLWINTDRVEDLRFEVNKKMTQILICQIIERTKGVLNMAANWTMKHFVNA